MCAVPLVTLARKVTGIHLFLRYPLCKDGTGPVNALGSVVLVLGVLLLPLQIWQGSLLDPHHLQWADFFLGVALLIGAFGNRDIVVHLARTWGPFWLIAISSSLLNGTPYVLLRGLGLVYVTSLTALIPMFFPALRRRGFDLLHAMGFLALGLALLDGVLQGVGLSEPFCGQNSPLLEGLPRLAGSFLHPNGLAHFLAMTGFLTIFFHRRASGSWIVWVYGATLVLTISRSVVALPLWVLSVARRRITVWLGALGLFLIVGISVFFSLGVALFLRRPSLGCGLLEVPVPESIPSFRLNVDS